MKTQNINTHHTTKLHEDELYEEKTLLRHKNHGLFRVLFLSVGFVIAILLLYFGARMFFKIGEITVEGNQRYSVDEIVESIDVCYGDFMFSFPSSSVKNSIKKNLPYVSEVDVDCIYPSKLVITVKEYEPEYICIQKNKYIVFSNELKVLEVADENKWEDSIITVELPNVSRAIEGEKIVFSELEKTDYISGFIKNLSEFKKDVKIDKIFLSDYFNIKMLCSAKYMVSFGKYDAIEVKLHTLSKVIESKTVSESASASIDISDPKEPRVIPYDRADAIS